MTALLLDTHVYWWLLVEGRRLGSSARRRIERSTAKGEVTVSALTFWELGMLANAGRLRLDRELGDLRALSTRSGITEIAVDGEIALVAARLQGLHGDPADRLIVATATVTGAALMTADAKILALKDGPTVIDAQH